MSAAALSVVVPVHDGAAWLGDTLESLRRQTRAPAEVIVVDDASTDASVRIAEHHPLRPRVVRLDRNRGVAFARNTGLVEASSEFVAFLDQDDLWLPCRAERLLRVLDADPARAVLVTSERVFAAEEDRAALHAAGHPFAPWVEFWRRRADVLSLLGDVSVDERRDPPVEALPVRRLLSGTVTVTTSYVLPRRLSLQVGGFASWLRSADDWMLLQTLSRHAAIYRVDDPTVLYRIHPGNTSLTTEWPMPLMLAAAAGRFGGGIVARGAGRDPAQVGRLVDSDFLMHELSSRARMPGLRARADAMAMAQLLGTDRGDRAGVARRLVPVVARSLVPAPVRALVRRLRARSAR